MEERVKQGLDTVFDGASHRYSIFYIFNATREEVERVIVELTHVGYFLHGVSTFETSHNGVMDGVFAFVGWKESPSAVYALSCKLPEKLCILRQIMKALWIIIVLFIFGRVIPARWKTVNFPIL